MNPARTAPIRHVLEGVTHAPCRAANAQACLLGRIPRCTDGLEALRELANLEALLAPLRRYDTTQREAPTRAPPPSAPMGTCLRNHPATPLVHPQRPDCELWEPDEPHHTPTKEDLNA